MQEKVLTAKQHLNDCLLSHGCITPADLIEFAQYHVEKALVSASETDVVYNKTYKHRSEFDKSSILNAYPKENIK